MFCSNLKPLKSYEFNIYKSKKIKKTLGFESQYTIKDSVNDLKDAFEKGLLPDSLTNEKYFNIKRMQSIKLN